MTNNRIISLILSIFILVSFSSGYTAVVAQEITEHEEITDSGETPEKIIDKNIELLISLGIFDAEWRDMSNVSVTRLSAAKSLLRLAGITSNISLSVYDDVKESDMGFAATACQLGYLDAFDDNTFHPDELITYIQAIKSLVMILGYDSLAKVEGGYIFVAQKLKLLSAIHKSASDNITYSEFATLFKKAMETEMLDSYIVDGKSVGKTTTGRTLMNSQLKLEKKQGIVEAVNGVSMIEGEILSDDVIIIDGYEYKTKNDYSDMLGYNVTFYVLDDDDEYVVYMDNSNSSNKTLEIDADDLISYKDLTYKYYKENKTLTASVAKDRVVIYNGRSISTYGLNELVPTNGFVKLIDNDNDGKFDVISVTSFETYLLSAVNKNDKILYDSLRGSVIYLNNYDKVNVYINGTSDDIFNLTEDSTVNLALSKYNDFVTIYASTKSISGKVSKIEKYNNQIDKVTIEGTEYPILKTYFNNYGCKDSISAGDDGVFYLDHLGRVTAFTKKASKDEKYAYLITAHVTDDLSNTLKLKVYDESNMMMTFECKPKIKIDNISGMNAESVLKYLKNGTDEIVSQLIKYRTNDDGLITYIDTAYNYAPRASGVDFSKIMPQNGESVDSFRIIKRTENDLWTGFYGSSYNFFGYARGLCVDKNAKIFVVPANPKSAGEEDFQAIPVVNYLKSDEKYMVDAYSSTKNYMISDVLVTQGEVGEENIVKADEDTVAMVSNVSYCLLDGEEAYEIELADGNYIYATEEAHSTNVIPYNKLIEGTVSLSRGDVICYKANLKNKVTDMRIIIDASEEDPSPGKQYKGSPYARWFDNFEPHIVYGDVYDRIGDYYVFCMHNLRNMDSWAPGADNPNRDPRTAELDYFKIYKIESWGSFYVYDKSIDKVFKGSVADLLDYVNFGNDYVRCLYATHKNGYYKWGAFIIKE